MLHFKFACISKSNGLRFTEPLFFLYYINVFHFKKRKYSSKDLRYNFKK